MLKQSFIAKKSTSTSPDISRKWMSRLEVCNLIACSLHALWAVLIVCVACAPGLGAPFTIRFEKFMDRINTTVLPEILKTATCNGTVHTDVFEWFDCLRSHATESDILKDDTSARIYNVKPTLLVELHVWVFLFVFESLTAACHLFLVRNKELYTSWLRLKLQPLRWFEYSITSSIMLLALFSLSRVSDVYILTSMFLLSVFLNLCGGLVFELLQYVEYDLRPPSHVRSIVQITRWSLFALAWVAFVLHYALIFDAYSTSIGPYLELPNSELWAQLWQFVSIMNYLILLAYASFPIVHIVQTMTRFKPNAYYKCELAYIVCSLVAKTILTMVIFVASVQRGGE